MNVKKRFVIYFIVQLITILLVFITLALGTFIIIGASMWQRDVDRKFTQLGLPTLFDYVEIHQETPSLRNESVLESIRQTGGWLQIINSKGQVLESHYTPEDVPHQYNVGELTAYWLNSKPFNYSLYIWVQYKNNIPVILVYGIQQTNEHLLNEVKRLATYTDDHLKLPQSLQNDIVAAGVWIHLLNDTGTEIGSFNKPNDDLNAYRLDDLLLRINYPDRYNEMILIDFDDETKQTWVLHQPFLNDQGSSEKSDLSILALWLFILFIVLVLLLLIFSFWYGHRLGTPIIHMVDWLQSIAKGNYSEPFDRKGKMRSLSRTGKIKRRYRLYTDMIKSLTSLQSSLRRNEEKHKQSEQTREEWISGVSHDLKTPLSSIKGYAHMLETDQYEWSKEEIKQFASIITDKAAYMDELINDLSLTYRLKNEDVDSIPKEKTELNRFIQSCIKHCMNDPRFKQREIIFIGTNHPIYYSISHIYFRRIIDNLIANAFLHNPLETKVIITLQNVENGRFVIAFQDNGNGMDEATIEQLFKRYYRGTNTEENSAGTGLGMVVTEQLVYLHGGVIEVESKQGIGTTIRLLFTH